MKSVLLRLEGPLQAWGTQGRFGIRDTDREPSKSGVVGLVGCALGMRRDDDAMLGRLAALQLAIRVDREGTVLRDFHTVGGGTFRGKAHTVWSPDGNKDPALTERFYLTDASFLAALGGEDHALIDQIADALRSPAWPLFLGRRACPPSTPVFAGLFDGVPRAALDTVPLGHREDQAAPAQVRFVVEAGPEDGRPRDDVPVSFTLYARRHARRYVRYEYGAPAAPAEAT